MSRQIRKIKEARNGNELGDKEDISADESVVNRGNVFDAFIENDDEPDQLEGEFQLSQIPINTFPEAVRIKKSSKKSAKSKKAKGKSSNSTELEEDIDELTNKFMIQDMQLLESTGVKESNVKSVPKRHILAVDYRILDAELELKRMFGSRVIEEGRNEQRLAVKAKYLLVKPKVTWPAWKNEGCSMVIFKHDSEMITFNLNHSKNYQAVQLEFLQAVDTNDPASIQYLLQRYPYSIDSLLQISLVYKHNGDAGILKLIVDMAADFVERALYAFEQSLHPMFNISHGTCQLTFLRAENRPIFTAIFRHIDSLARKGCWKAAFEFQKLLFALSPSDDPLCSLLFIDFYALKSGSFQWYLTFWDENVERLQVLPNAMYSRAVCQWEIETLASDSHDSSDLLLQEAIRKFPGVVTAIFEKLSYSELFMKHQIFSPYNATYAFDMYATLSIYQDLYIEKNHSLWKVPGILGWLRKNVSEVYKTVLDAPNQDPTWLTESRRLIDSTYGKEGTIPTELKRLIFISDAQQFNTRLPAVLEPIMGYRVFNYR